MRTFFGIVVVGAVLTGMVAPVRAHHAFAAEFDAKRPITLRGVVTKMEWVNPHSWIHVDVKAADGKVQSWMIECGPPGALVRRGWSKESIPPGLEVLIDGFQAKDGSFRANGKDVTLPDGRRLFAGSSGTGAPYDDVNKGK
jgi:hypothetical protein